MKNQEELNSRLKHLATKITKNEYRGRLGENQNIGLEKEFETICWVLDLDCSDTLFELTK